MKRQFRNKKSLVMIAIVMFICNISCSSADGFVQTIDTTKNIYIVNINAKTSTKKNPVAIELKAGIYSVSVIGVSEGGKYNAWKPWFHKEKKNKDGEWVKGWVNKYSYSSSEFSEVTLHDSTIHETPVKALDNAIDSKFTLKNKAVVYFYILDSPHMDNKDGISLQIAMLDKQDN